MKKNLFLLIALAAFTLMSCSASNSQGNAGATAKGKNDNGMTKVKLETTLGDIVVELYNETPQHRDNFIKLVKSGYYDGVLLESSVPSNVGKISSFGPWAKIRPSLKTTISSAISKILSW